MKNTLENDIVSFSPTQSCLIASDCQSATKLAAEHLLFHIQDTLNSQGFFSLALSGGSTPNALFQLLSQDPFLHQIDWKRVKLFWGDERCVPQDHKDSNYRSAMDAGLCKLPLLRENVFPMPGHKEDLVAAAASYEKTIQGQVPGCCFDYIMLGVGPDGHTASLFPDTPALLEREKFVISQYVPQKTSWRMTLTYPCLKKAKKICIYAMGKSKAPIVKEILLEKCSYPASSVGHKENPVLWILDQAAACHLVEEK